MSWHLFLISTQTLYVHSTKYFHHHAKMASNSQSSGFQRSEQRWVVLAIIGERKRGRGRQYHILREDGETSWENAKDIEEDLGENSDNEGVLTTWKKTQKFKSRLRKRRIIPGDDEDEEQDDGTPEGEEDEEGSCREDGDGGDDDKDESDDDGEQEEEDNFDDLEEDEEQYQRLNDGEDVDDNHQYLKAFWAPSQQVLNEAYENQSDDEEQDEEKEKGDSDEEMKNVPQDEDDDDNRQSLSSSQLFNLSQSYSQPHVGAQNIPSSPPPVSSVSGSSPPPSSPPRQSPTPNPSPTKVVQKPSLLNQNVQNRIQTIITPTGTLGLPTNVPITIAQNAATALTDAQMNQFTRDAIKKHTPYDRDTIPVQYMDNEFVKAYHDGMDTLCTLLYDKMKERKCSWLKGVDFDHDYFPIAIDIISSASSNILLELMAGNLAYAVKNNTDVAKTMTSFKRIMDAPGLYWHGLVDDSGLAPTPNQMLLLCGYAEDYLPNAKKDNFALKVDRAGYGTSWDGKTGEDRTLNGGRRFLSDSKLKWSPKKSRVNRLKRGIQAYRDYAYEFDQKDRNTPMPQAPAEIGYAINIKQRLDQHAKDTSSNHMMSLFKVLAQLYLKGTWDMQSYPIYFIWDPIQAAPSEAMFSELGHAYLKEGNGFNDFQAGVSVRSAITAPGLTWIRYRSLLDHGPYEANMAREVEKYNALLKEMEAMEAKIEQLEQEEADIDQSVHDKVVEMEKKYDEAIERLNTQNEVMKEITEMCDIVIKEMPSKKPAEDDNMDEAEG
jgi:hypothetical protein